MCVYSWPRLERDVQRTLPPGNNVQASPVLQPPARRYTAAGALAQPELAIAKGKSAMPAGFESGWVLAAAYAVLALLCSAQVVLIWRHGHQLLSYRVGFLALSAAWSGAKAVFWLDQVHHSLLFMQVFFRLPTAIEAASYLLFLVFCAKQVHSRGWVRHGYGRRVWTAFVVVNSLSLCSVFVSAVLVCRATAAGQQAQTQPAAPASDSSAAAGWPPPPPPWEQRASDLVDSVFTTSMYSLLTAVTVTYGWLIWRDNQPAAAAATAAGGPPGRHRERRESAISFKTGFVKKDKQRVSGIVPVLGLLSVVFCCRALYTLLLAVGLLRPIEISAPDGGPKSEHNVRSMLALDRVWPSVCPLPLTA
eukprot:SAG22_NODE_58_length_23645_cov_16.637943_16_plen_362_part_00